MGCKQDKDEWFPIKEVLAGRGGAEHALGEGSPQVSHHFTRIDQIDQLIGASEDDPEVGFMARLMMLCSFPRTNPGNRLQYVRRNGPYTLVLIAGGLNRLPYGNLPRLLLAWVCTEAVRTQSRDLVLGRSLSEFMRKLGMGDSSGGKGGERTRLRTQMKRLFRAQVSLIYEDERGEASVSSLVADRTELWWNPRRPDEPVLWDSRIRLGEGFYNEIVRCPVPLDLNILKALRRSSLGLDLYLWLTYRIFSLKKPIHLAWPRLYRQFGVEPDKANNRVTVDNFRKDCLREMIKIRTAWPALKYSTARGALVLFPSKPAVTRLRLVEQESYR